MVGLFSEKDNNMDKELQPPKSDVRIMKCEFCKSTNINTIMNVGFDIDPSGEENQHLDCCKECGAERFWADRIEYREHDIVAYRWVGKWIKDKDFFEDDFGPEGW